MELGLSLGDSSRAFETFLTKDRDVHTTTTAAKKSNNTSSSSSGLGFCVALGIGRQQDQEIEKTSGRDLHGDESEDQPTTTATATATATATIKKRSSIFTTSTSTTTTTTVDPPLQLDLLPLAPVPRNPILSWPSSDNGSSEGGSSGQMGMTPARGFDVNRLPPATEEEELEDGAAAVSSPNSVASSFQMDFCIYRGAGNVGGNKRDSEAAGIDAGEAERASSRASDEDENGLSRKKLRLSKEQSAYLEESFKEHNTLNPKQKLALAKQLNLRPRQVEVWFQNRRARTKLKQTEVDCEYLKRCCETLTEENRRLHKELQDLRALKTTSNPFYMQLPATTLTMCPSCERVATTTSSTAAPTTTTTAPNSTSSTDPTSKTTPFPISRPRFYPFPHSQPQQPHHQSAAS